MSPSEKMKLLKFYRDKQKGSSSSVKQVEIGESKVGSYIGNIETVSESEIAHKATRPDINDNGKKFEIQEDDVFDFSTVGSTVVDFDDDGLFKPMQFMNEVVDKDENTRNVYEDLKSDILSIDCTKGLDFAYSELDRVLNSVSDIGSSGLTNNQLLVLISSMIIKLEELNSMNYPEIVLDDVRDKLNRDGKKASFNNTMGEFFFVDFFRYYQTVELEQFDKLKTKYSDELQKFSEFQQKKSDMLMTLLKWLIN